MSPEYGATCGFFPVDDVTLDYLRLTGRCDERIALVEAYCKENMLWHDAEEHPTYSQVVELDLGDVEPSLAGPRRPQDRVPLANAKEAFIEALDTFGVDYTNGSADKAVADTFPASDPTTEQQPGGEPEPEADRAVAHGATMTKKSVPVAGEDYSLEHGSVVIAAITSCTNTSNPSVMIGAGLLAKKAVELGLKRKPWVKSSLAPGSKVVTEYYERSGLDALSRRARLQHRRLRLHDVHRQLRPAAGRDRRGGRARASSSSAPCCPATATSRRASTATSRRTTSRRRRSSSRTRSPAAWTSTC